MGREDWSAGQADYMSTLASSRESEVKRTEDALATSDIAWVLSSLFVVKRHLEGQIRYRSRLVYDPQDGLNAYLHAYSVTVLGLAPLAILAMALLILGIG
jgi:hypothetical protein